MTQSEYLKKQLDSLPLTNKFKKQMMDILQIFKKETYSENTIYFIISTAHFLLYKNKQDRKKCYEKMKKDTNDDIETWIIESVQDLVEKLVKIEEKYRNFAMTLLLRVYLEGFPLAYISLNDESQWEDMEYLGSDIQFHKECSSILRDKKSGDIYQSNSFKFADRENEVVYRSSEYSVNYINEDYYYPCSMVIDYKTMENIANKYINIVLEEKYGAYRQKKVHRN